MVEYMNITVFGVIVEILVILVINYKYLTGEQYCIYMYINTICTIMEIDGKYLYFNHKMRGNNEL